MKIKMNTKDSICQSVIVILAALLILSFFAILNLHRKNNKSEDVETSVEYYTYQYVSPESKKDSLVGSISIPIPVYAPRKVDTIYIGKDSTEVITCDSDSIIIPITQKIYSDSSYTAYVSGFNANLDSIRFVIPELTKVKISKDNKRFGVGLIGGIGFGLTSKQIEPFLGVGISYRLY